MQCDLKEWNSQYTNVPFSWDMPGRLTFDSNTLSCRKRLLYTWPFSPLKSNCSNSMLSLYSYKPTMSIGKSEFTKAYPGTPDRRDTHSQLLSSSGHSMQSENKMTIITINLKNIDKLLIRSG